MATVAKSQPLGARRSSDFTWLAVAALLVVVGVITYFLQLSQGMGVTGISQAVVWGVYIAAFFTVVGLGSGLVMLAAFSDLGFVPALLPARKRLLLAGIACYIAGAIMIVMDIGQPLRAFNMIFSANFTSPFVWDFFGLVLSGIIALVYFFTAAKGKLLPWLAVIAAGLVVVVEGWILAMSAGTALWRSGTLPAIFLVEALVAAAALLLLTRTQADSWLRRSLLLLLPVLLLLNVFEIVPVLYTREADALTATRLLTANPVFWAQVALGIVLPFVLLAWFAKSRTSILVAAVLAIAGVFAAKTLLLAAGQAVPFFQTPVAYTPTYIEAGGVIGIIGLAALLFLFGRRFLLKEA